MDFNIIDWGYVMDIAIATVVGALIAVAGSVVVNWLGNRKGYKDIDGKIGTLDNTTLSGQHNKITKDIINSINDNTKELNNKLDNKIGVLNNTTLSGQNKEIIKKVENISHFLEKEKEEKLLKNNLLGYDAQKVNSSIENLSGFAEIMKNLSSENSKLKAENYNLKNDNQNLTQENEKLKQRLSRYQNNTYTNGLTQKMSLD